VVDEGPPQIVEGHEQPATGEETGGWNEQRLEQGKTLRCSDVGDTTPVTSEEQKCLVADEQGMPGGRRWKRGAINVGYELEESSTMEDA